MDSLEKLIKQYLEKHSGAGIGEREHVLYPTSEDLFRYLEDELQGAELERMLLFLRKDAEAQTLVLKARELLQREAESENRPVPPELVERAKSLMTSPDKSAACPHCGKPITPFKKPLRIQKWTNLFWMLVMAVSFTLSFVFRRYYMQCLAVSLLAGFKWALEMRATKTQILVYKALSEGSEHGHSRLQEVKNRDGGI